MRTWICPVILALAGWSQPSKADSAAQMASFCGPYRQAVITGPAEGGGNLINVPKADANSQICWGAFTAFQELITLSSRSSDSPYLDVCAPSEATRLEFIRIYIRYMDEHPETGHLDFGRILLRAMWRAFPCRHNAK